MIHFSHLLALFAMGTCSGACRASEKQYETGHVEAISTNEMIERNDISDRVNYAISKKDFTALNAMEVEFRTRRARTPSGTWKLSHFYGSFGYSLPVRQENGICVNHVAPFAEAWAIFSPDNPAPHILKAASLVDYGGCIRGDGYGYEVAPAAMKAALKSASAAKQVLDHNRAVASKDPQYYGEMIRAYTVLGYSRQHMQALLEEATGKEPYYYPTYFLAVQYYLPEWNGQFGDMDWLGRFAVERTAKEGKGLYARIFWILDGYTNADRGSMDWSMTTQGMRDVQQAYPNDWNLANFARMSCRMGEYKVAAEFIAQLNSTIVSSWPGLTEWENCLQATK